MDKDEAEKKWESKREWGVRGGEISDKEMKRWIREGSIFANKIQKIVYFQDFREGSIFANKIQKIVYLVNSLKYNMLLLAQVVINRKYCFNMLIDDMTFAIGLQWFEMSNTPNFPPKSFSECC